MLSQLMAEEQGQGLIEYALILFFIAIAAVTVVNALGIGLNNYYNNIESSIP